MAEQNIDISIVVTCYNEAQEIEKNIQRIEETMQATKYSYEIILYDDGSTDGTQQIGRVLGASNNNIIWREHTTNLGRGRTVSDGLKTARGRISGFIDIDLEAPPEHILPLVREIEKGADLAVATRMSHLNINKIPFCKKIQAVVYWILRFILSSGYTSLVRRLLKVNLSDTEVGFKFFNHQKILPVLDEIEDNRWFWDTEIMVRSYYKGLKIKEHPALFLRNLERKSSVNVLKDTWGYFCRIIRFREKLAQMKILGSRKE